MSLTFLSLKLISILSLTMDESVDSDQTEETVDAYLVWVTEEVVEEWPLKPREPFHHQEKPEPPPSRAVTPLGEDLRKKKAFSDITFIVGPDQSAKKYSGHRVVLAMTSPVFEAMFQGDNMANKSRVVRVSDISPSGFENLLRYADNNESILRYLRRDDALRRARAQRYAYSDALRIQSIEDAMMTAYAAKKYALPHLLDQCLAFLETNVNAKNVCQIYEFAQSVDAPLLIFLCLNIMDRQTFHVLTSSNFIHVLPSTAELIASRCYLNLYSEYTVYIALVQWAEEECKRRKLNPDDVENVRQMLDLMLPYIRFLAMSAEEFAKGPAKGGLLTLDECFSIFMNLAIPDCIALPPGFCPEFNKRSAPPEYFVCSRYRGLSYSPPGRPLRVFGIRFSTLNKNVFLVGAAFPVRLDNTYYSVRLPKYSGVIRIARRTIDGKIERQESEVTFQLAKGKDTVISLRKPYYIRRGEKYEVELQSHALINEDVIVPLLRNKKREDIVEGVTFQFIPFTRVKLSSVLDITEFSEVHFYC